MTNYYYMMCIVCGNDQPTGQCQPTDPIMTQPQRPKPYYYCVASSIVYWVGKVMAMVALWRPYCIAMAQPNDNDY